MSPSTPNRFLLIGGRGWIASHLHALVTASHRIDLSTTVRMEDRPAMEAVFDTFNPTRVICCAGFTGRPNDDQCEEKKQETVMCNVTGLLMLAHLCWERGVHLSVMATGCIYTSTYTPDRTQLLSRPFTEDDPANFNGSFYSRTKAHLEEIMRHTYPDVLILRVRMPISDDLHPRSFVTKITKYEHVVNIPNSNSILHDLLPVAIAMSEQEEVGIYNFTNPGAISHNEVLSLYQQIVDPGYTWKNFTLEEQAKVIKADRSNCELDCAKLMALVKEYQGMGIDVEVPEIHEAYQRCFGRMREQMSWKQGAEAGAALSTEAAVTVNV
nr:hypothetical protein B0A51_04706 [Rachicladosporium sp. CCFEE 5018]